MRSSVIAVTSLYVFFAAVMIKGFSDKLIRDIHDAALGFRGGGVGGFFSSGDCSVLRYARLFCIWRTGCWQAGKKIALELRIPVPRVTNIGEAARDHADKFFRGEKCCRN
jgi:hypothetical protein